MNRFFRKIQVSLILCLACMMFFIPSALAGETWCSSLLGSNSDETDYACIDAWAMEGKDCINKKDGSIENAAKTISRDLGWGSTWTTTGGAWYGLSYNWSDSVLYEGQGIWHKCTERGFSDSELVDTMETVDGIVYRMYD